jgi:hypothetical protein
MRYPDDSGEATQPLATALSTNTFMKTLDIEAVRMSSSSVVKIFKDSRATGHWKI